MEITVTKTHYKIADGFFGGIIGAIAMGIVGMMGTLLFGRGFFQPLILMGYAFQPLDTMPEATSAIIFKGLMIHMAMSMMAGIVFVIIANLVHFKNNLWILGAIYAALIWAIDQFGMLRALDPTMATQMNQFIFLLAYLAFGMVLGVYVSWRNHTHHASRNNHETSF